MLNTFGGNGDYTYLWNNGSTLSFIDNLAPGIYSVNIQDAGGQSIFQEFNIEEPNTLFIETSINHPQCWYDTGSASLEITGGTEPYFIDWSNVDPLFLTPGIFPVRVTDANGCETIQEVIIETEAPIEITYTLQSTSSLCYGENSGTATIEIMSGNGPVSIDWEGENPLQ